MLLTKKKGKKWQWVQMPVICWLVSQTGLMCCSRKYQYLPPHVCFWDLPPPQLLPCGGWRIFAGTTQFTPLLCAVLRFPRDQNSNFFHSLSFLTYSVPSKSLLPCECWKGVWVLANNENNCCYYGVSLLWTLPDMLFSGSALTKPIVLSTG